MSKPNNDKKQSTQAFDLTPLTALVASLRALGQDAQVGTTPNLAERIWDVASQLAAALATIQEPKEPA